MSSFTIDWSHVIIKKEARESKDLDEVQHAAQNYILVYRRILNKEEFYIRRDIAESYERN